MRCAMRALLDHFVELSKTANQDEARGGFSAARATRQTPAPLRTALTGAEATSAWTEK